MFGMRKRHKSESPEEGVQLGLIITPFLDVAFQLLAFFVMVYNPSPLETHLDGQLKQFSRAAGAAKDMKPKDDELPADEEPDENVDLRVIVRAVGKGKVEGDRTDGQPTQLLVKYKDKVDPVTIADVDTDFKTGLRRLGDLLKKLRDAAPGGKAQVDIDPDANLKYEYFVQVYDVCRAAKFGQIGFNAPGR